jgi:hypothetical protein
MKNNTVSEIERERKIRLLSPRRQEIKERRTYIYVRVEQDPRGHVRPLQVCKHFFSATSKLRACLFTHMDYIIWIIFEDYIIWII